MSKQQPTQDPDQLTQAAVLDDLQHKIDEMEKAEKHKKPKHNYLEEIELLKDQLKAVQQSELRAVADYQNLERRMQQEKLEWIKYGNQQLLAKVLDVSDNLDRAAKFINDQGLTMVRDQFNQVLTEFGVTPIEVLGKPFDHETMEAISKEAGEVDIVIRVEQKGYTLDGKVLRPAKVVVGMQGN